MPPAERPLRGTKLPVALTRFLGRNAELDRLRRMLGEHRLITVVGAPGAGKSRFAAEHARAANATEQGFDEVWICDGTAAADALDVTHAVARALSLDVGSVAAQGDPGARVATALAARGPTLLVIDNLDRAARAPDLAIPLWLEAAGELSIIVTSRLRLALPGEAVLELAPLATPEPGATPEAALASPAVALLLQRARAVRPDYPPAPAEIALLAELARRLDGLPLALELAAARMAFLGVRDILERLDRGLDVLGQGQSSDRVSLRGALDWSWSMLEPSEQTALAQLSVFRGSFSSKAAEAVIELASPADSALETVVALCRHSLVRASEVAGLPGELRFRLLETVRAYAAEKLRAAGGDGAADQRHARYYVALGTELAHAVDRSDGPRALAMLDQERENLAAVHERAVASRVAGRASEAVRAALALEPLFYMRGPTSECLRMLTAALDLDLAEVPPSVVALGQKALGRALRDAGRLVEARSALERALEVARAAGDRSAEARVIGQQSFHAEAEGRLEAAIDRAAASVAAARAGNDTRTEGMALAVHARLLTQAGRFAEASSAYDDALRIDRAVGNRYAEAFVLTSRADLNRARGLLDAARADLEEGLSMYREFGERRHEATALVQLANLEKERGAADAAREAFDRAIGWLRADGSPQLGAVVAQLADLERETGALDIARGHYLEALAWARRSSDAELVDKCQRWLAAQPSTQRDPRACVVARSGRWFRVGESQPVALFRRHALRLILQALLERRLDAPGEALSQHDILEAGWPGQRVQPQAGMLRVYNALSTLRKLGLRDILLSRDDGYLLDSSQTVVAADSDTPP